MQQSVDIDMFDIIGDIHGRSEILKRLLHKLGYNSTTNGFSHNERRALFLGDYFNRGEDVPGTIVTVRGMVENYGAIALLGNHDRDALLYYYDKNNSLLTSKRKEQLDRSFGQYSSPGKLKSTIEWISKLPILYENDYFRAVHASWVPAAVDTLQEYLDNCRLPSTGEFLAMCSEESTANQVLETVLTGKKALPPEGVELVDSTRKDGDKLRVRWWLDPAKTTWSEYSVYPLQGVNSHKRPSVHHDSYYHSSKPVFFGHYCLKDPVELMTDHVCCLDGCVAGGGPLYAYRWDGGALNPSRLVFED